MSDIFVLSPGMYTTFQDAGRFGYRHLAIPVSGAMDQSSYELANRLVNNDPSEAVLEITLLGPRLAFNRNLVLAVTGADLDPQLDSASIAMNRAVPVSAGQVLKFGRPKKGCRSYLSVAGGFDLAMRLDSYSAYEAASLGRPRLKKGDEINTKVSLSQLSDQDYIISHPDFDQQEIEILRGPEWSSIDSGIIDRLTHSEFVVSNDSNRMAIKLDGLTKSPWHSPSITSSAVLPGTVQLPPDGNPIILMRDCQTTGGYPRVALVTEKHIDLLAQKKPGDRISFRLI